MPAGKLGIVVGGGPAPGINGVIAAATIEARNNGLDVLGFYDGFQHLMAGKADQYRPLHIQDVSRIHVQGGSILRTSRANPTKKAEDIARVVETLRSLGVKYMVTIGGDDTASSALKLSQATEGEISVAHVPKTIDNDLPLPPAVPTFGYETARHVGTEIVHNLMSDAKTAPRWYIVVSMGRKAGHLALGIGKAASAPLTLIPEEFEEGKLTFGAVLDIVEGAILKRLAMGRGDGVAILAEGLLEYMSREHLEETFKHCAESRDPFGHLVLDLIPFGQMVRDHLRARFNARGLNIILVNKNLGYELRSADPIPFDREYTRNLGYAAVHFLLSGGSGMLVSIEGGYLEPRQLHEMLDPRTKKFHLRMVNTKSIGYQVARKYMIRMDAKDREDRTWYQKLVETSRLDEETFEARFGELMK